MYKEDNSIKIILLGEAGCGKTNLINVCCGLEFDENSASNITASFSEKKITIKNIEYNLKLWDTAGQEKFRSLNSLFIKDSQICILVYDITDKGSFKELDYWLKTVEEKLGKKPLLAVVGNKLDLFESEEVTEEEGENYSNKIGAFFQRTSAKENRTGFSNFINKLVQEFLEKNKFNEWEFISRDKDKNRVTINKNEQLKKKKSNLCLISY